MSEIIRSTCNAWQKALAVDSTGTAGVYASVVEIQNPTTAGNAPALLTNAGFFKATSNNAVVESVLCIRPIATAVNNVTGNMRVYGWNEYQTSTGVIWYVPTLLLDVAYTAGNITSTLGTSWFVADTITRSAGSSDGVRISSPASESVAVNDVPAYVLVDLMGSQYFSFDFDPGTATACNALWKLLS